MPIGNCVNKLFKEGDYNVRTTICNTSKQSTPEAACNAWCEVIRDCLGGGIVNSSKRFTVMLTLANGTTHSLFSAGTGIVSLVKFHCHAPISIRLDIKELGSKPDTSRSWVILNI